SRARAAWRGRSGRGSSARPGWTIVAKQAIGRRAGEKAGEEGEVEGGSPDRAVAEPSARGDAHVRCEQLDPGTASQGPGERHVLHERDGWVAAYRIVGGPALELALVAGREAHAAAAEVRPALGGAKHPP